MLQMIKAHAIALAAVSLVSVTGAEAQAGYGIGRTATPAVAEEMHLDADTEGVVVTELTDGGTAANLGFQKGDVIVAVNNQKILKTSDLERATREQSRLWRITLVRGGQQINVTLGG